MGQCNPHPNTTLHEAKPPVFPVGWQDSSSSTNMDVCTPEVAQRRKRKRIIGAAAAGLVIVITTIALARFQLPRRPSKRRLWVEPVKRGTTSRECAARCA